MLIFGAVMNLSTCASYASTVPWLSVLRVAELNWFSALCCVSRETQSSTRPSVAFTVVVASERVEETVPCPW